ERRSELGLGPLADLGDGADEGEGRAADIRGEKGDVVELRLGERVEDPVVPEHGQASRLVVVQGSGNGALRPHVADPRTVRVSLPWAPSGREAAGEGPQQSGRTPKPD